MVKKIVIVVLAGILLLFLVILANGYRTKKQLTGFCAETTGGTSLVSAKQKALQNGFRVVASNSGTTVLVTAGGVMGRYVCAVEHDGDIVVKASLLFND